MNANNTSAYGVQMLFRPNRKLNIIKYTLWTDSIHLTDPDFFIHCPFDYDAHSNVIKK